MPDFDIDFCQDRRDEVIRYVREKYGADRVAQIITFGKLQARAVLRDVGRVLGMPYGQVDRIAKLVPNNPANPVDPGAGDRARAAAAARRRDEDEQVRAADRDRAAARRPVAPRLDPRRRRGDRRPAADELVPLYRDPRSDMPVTQFNMKYVEQAGLVKFDFLGLKTLTVLAQAERLVNERGDAARPRDAAAGRCDDLRDAGARRHRRRVPAGMARHARRAAQAASPTASRTSSPLSRSTGRARWTTSRATSTCKHGNEQPDYLHPMLEPILDETYGIMIYQEQVMQIAQELAGYSLGGADLLRRAMGKKIKAEMDAQREIFIEGAVAARHRARAQPTRSSS